MPVVIATITPLAGCIDRVQAILTDVVPRVQQREGCERYSLLRGRECLVIIEKWASADALREWGASPELSRLHDALRPLVETLSDNFVVLRPVPLGDLATGLL